VNKILHFTDALAILIKSVTDGTCWSFRNHEFHHKKFSFSARFEKKNIPSHRGVFFIADLF